LLLQTRLLILLLTLDIISNSEKNGKAVATSKANRGSIIALWTLYEFWLVTQNSRVLDGEVRAQTVTWNLRTKRMGLIACRWVVAQQHSRTETVQYLMMLCNTVWDGVLSKASLSHGKRFNNVGPFSVSWKAFDFVHQEKTMASHDRRAHPVKFQS
jgi:hypothetical protein